MDGNASKGHGLGLKGGHRPHLGQLMIKSNSPTPQMEWTNNTLNFKKFRYSIVTRTHKKGMGGGTAVFHRKIISKR